MANRTGHITPQSKKNSITLPCINPTSASGPDIEPPSSRAGKSPPPTDHLDNGGQVSISPPAKVKTHSKNSVAFLASNIDTLYVSIYLTWNKDGFFEYLTDMKNTAESEGKDVFLVFLNKWGEDEYIFKIKPHGGRGYEWLLYRDEYFIKVGRWKELINRPNIIVEIRSQHLWTVGFERAVDYILNFLVSESAVIDKVLLTRVDLCGDYLFPEKLWSPELVNYKVTRARYSALHNENETLTGLSIGKGNISARIYDKVYEIKHKSKKYWMYTAWGLETVPEDCTVIRIEVQIRREVLKELGCGNYENLPNQLDSLWNYCTSDWLKFQDNPGRHHTQRTTLPWWKSIQKAFERVTPPTPLIRSKSIKINRVRIIKNCISQMTSLIAILLEEEGLQLSHPCRLRHGWNAIRNHAQQNMTDFEFDEAVKQKRMKYRRLEADMIDSHYKRLENGLPSNFDPKLHAQEKQVRQNISLAKYQIK